MAFVAPADATTPPFMRKPVKVLAALRNNVPPPVFTRVPLRTPLASKVAPVLTWMLPKSAPAPAIGWLVAKLSVMRNVAP